MIKKTQKEQPKKQVILCTQKDCKYCEKRVKYCLVDRIDPIYLCTKELVVITEENECFRKGE